MPFHLALPRPPQDARKRRVILAVAAVAALGITVGALRGGATTPSATSGGTAATTTSTSAPPPATTTTVDPKAIQAGVAALLSHEGATPQELASVPSSPHGTSSARHVKSGGSHTHH